MSEKYIPRSRLNGRPLFYCEACGDLTGLETADGQVFECSVCGWKLVLE